MYTHNNSVASFLKETWAPIHGYLYCLRFEYWIKRPVIYSNGSSQIFFQLYLEVFWL